MLLDKELFKDVVEGFIFAMADYITEAVTTPFEHIRLWNIWRKRNMNSKIHKFLVLIGVVVSPTFEHLRCFEKED